MNDRELLELAAKSAGYDYVSPAGYIVVDGIPGNWNPLTDDGDALRLAVKLHMGISIPPFLNPRADVLSFSDPLVDVIEVGSAGSDACAVTRRAIVKVAAEMGRRMK